MKYALDNGMIDLEYMREAIEMQKRNNILENHANKIWQGDDGRWRTYLPDDKKGRVLKKRTSQLAIEDVVVNYYKEKEENPTIHDIYKEWINGKVMRDDITMSTKNRYDRQYSESMSEFGERHIKSITEYDVEEFVLSAIHECKLTTKGYSNLRTLLFGIFKYAKKKKFISFSITETIKDIEISRKAFRREVKNDENLVFTQDEQPKIISYITSSNLDLINLGILLLFKSGLRPGELSGLKKVDVTSDTIYVNRTEIRYEDESGEIHYEVRDFPKTEAGIREVVLPDESLWILKKIQLLNPFGEYLFEQNGDRIKTHVFRNRLRTICKNTGIKPKSLNKIRKTYGTILIDNNVDESLIISQMGHTDINTTKEFYYKNRKSKSQKKSAINNVSGL